MIQQPVWAVVSAVALLAAIGLFGQQALFVLGAEEVTGTVSEIYSENGRCGSSRNKYDCTKYTAEISFFANTNRHTTTTSAGTSHGYNRPITEASYRVDQELSVLYDPTNPGHASHNTLTDVWGKPIFAAVCQLVTMIIAVSKPKTRKSSWHYS